MPYEKTPRRKIEMYEKVHVEYGRTYAEIAAEFTRLAEKFPDAVLDFGSHGWNDADELFEVKLRDETDMEMESRHDRELKRHLRVEQADEAHRRMRTGNRT